jgi:glycosyltransferase involved in cell wall biosynthesis
VVPNGIDPARFAGAPVTEEAKRRLGLEGRTVLGFVGFVRPWHGLERVLDWMAGSRRDDVVLLLVGDGPARAQLEGQARRLGLAGRFVCTGIVGRELIRDRLAAFDVALQPAVVDYASPLKLFEYMAMGLAIIAPDSPNIREILTDGHDGLLCGPEALPAVLDRLVGDPELRRRLGANARETLLGRGYTWEANARLVEELAAACVAEAGLRRAQRRLDRLVEPR